MNLSWKIPMLVLGLLAVPVYEALAQDEVMVYRRGKILAHDEDMSQDLHEVVIETYSIADGKLARTETIETYYFVSDDGEVINARVVDEKARKVFRFEERDGKVYFKEVRTTAPEAAPHGEAGGAVSREAERERVREKMRFIAQKIAGIPAKPFGSATTRRKIISRDLSDSMRGWSREEIQDIVGFVGGLDNLTPEQRAYVLRSFGWDRYFNGDAETALLYYKGARALMPRWSSVNYQLAQAYQSLKQDDEAAMAYGRALVLQPRVKYADKLSECLGDLRGTKRLTRELAVKLGTALDEIRAEFGKKEGSRAEDLVRTRFREIMNECYGKDWGDPGGPAGDE